MNKEHMNPDEFEEISKEERINADTYNSLYMQ